MDFKVCFAVFVLVGFGSVFSQNEYLPPPPTTTTTTVKPCACPAINKPVCGSNRAVYSNGCVASCAGIEECCGDYAQAQDDSSACVCMGPADKCKV